MIINSVKAAIEKYNMISNSADITVALSGGADSVSLLYVLLELKSEYGFTLKAAHLNHCLRADESDADERFVKTLCNSLGVELFCESIDVKSVALSSGESIELAARRVRYEFLNRVAKGLIATAHTANDNIETVLHNMVRGAGLNGLTGIPAKRDNIIRPLILTERSKIEEYLKSKGASYRTDSTNLEDIYTRNKIRHNVVPVLKEVNSNAVGNVSRLTQVLKEDANFIDAYSNNEYNNCYIKGGLDLKKLLKLHKAIRNRVLTKFYEKCVGVTPERIHIELINDMLLDKKSRQSVQRDMYAVVNNGILTFELKKEEEKSFCFEVDKGYNCTVNGVRVYTETYDNFKKLCSVNSLLLKSAVDCDKICGRLVIRNRIVGDKIKIDGRNVTKTVKKLFNESKFDINSRNSVPIAADENGVVWVCGFGVDSRVAVDSSTNTVLLFDISV